MRIIALMNQKGGVGKTTTTANLGAALAEAGKRVCLIDLDPQAHLTINYGLEPGGEQPSLYDVLCHDKGFLEAVHKLSPTMAIIPSSIDLAGAEMELVSVLGREMILKKRIEAAKHDFDYILLDCPPSLGLLTINSLACAHEVIIPMQAHFLALQGMAKLLETVQLVNKRMNPLLKVAGIVLTMFDAQTKLGTEVINELNNFIEQAKGKPLPWASARVFNARIRRNIKLAECPSFGQTILQYDGASNGASDYRALANELIAMHAPAIAPAVPAEAPTKTSGLRFRPAPAVSVNRNIDPTKLAAAQIPSQASVSPRIQNPAPIPAVSSARAVPSTSSTDVASPDALNQA